MKPATLQRTLIAGLALWGIIATAACCVLQSRIADGHASASRAKDAASAKQWLDHVPHATPATRMAGDGEGALRTVVLRADAREPALYAPTQGALADALATRCDVHVIHERPEERAMLVAGMRDERRDLVQWHTARGPGSAWLRDVASLAYDGDGPVWLLHAKAHYDLMAPRHGLEDAHALAGAATDARPRRSGLALDGGELVCDGERVLVAEGALRRALAAGHAKSEAAFLARITEQTGRPAVLVRNAGTDAWGHCDLVLAPAGRRVLVVGSPSLADQLLRSVSADEIAAFEQRHRALATKAQAIRPVPEGAARAGLVTFLRERSTASVRQTAFARLRGGLRADGFELIEVPFLSIDPRKTGSRFVLSYTNVLLDEQDGRKVAYVPTFGLPTLDRAALAAWRKAGWKPVPIDCLGPAMLGGGLRCLTQVVRATDASNPR